VAQFMSWTTRTKLALASIVFRHRVLNRFAHRYLPRKRMAAAVLLFDGGGRLLIVKPSYRKDWLIPGGTVENDESPWTAARRETMEEIGLDIKALSLLVTDWRPTDDEYDDSLHFIFAGGTLSGAQQAAIRTDGLEIVDHRFATAEEAARLLDPYLMKRIRPCLHQTPDRPLLMNRGEPDPDVV
jgi:8-oxo-dGTP pyrophosphatase MutT (NUDIX family)